MVTGDGSDRSRTFSVLFVQGEIVYSLFFLKTVHCEVKSPCAFDDDYCDIYMMWHSRSAAVLHFYWNIQRLKTD